jgi:membrane protein YqaA with SNARE-associated domain
MLVLVALWALAEATLFFIVADVPIMAVAIRYGMRRGLVAALVAAMAAALGGLAMMQWAAMAPGASRAMIESLPGIDPGLLDQAGADWRAGGTWAMLRGSFGGMPYKLYAYAAGVDRAGIAGFFIASLIARLPRFLLVAWVSGMAGPYLRRRLRGRVLWLVFGLAWAVFYAWYFAAMGG